ncbi:MAG: DNA repair protein RecN [Victivallaceae bacterium]|nr:DNA repair protein RecN [Victivallaceae bacterium]
MLAYLKITDFALIERAELEFGPGFNVVTGESGAGKSILMGAVELLLGGRADHTAIRTDCEKCVVEGVFVTPAELRERVSDRLNQSGISFDPASGELRFRRVVGKSAVRNFINDTLVSSKLLSEFGAELVDRHGANDQLSLLSPVRQLDLLDRYAGAEKPRARCAGLCDRLTGLAAQRAEFESGLPDRSEADHLEQVLEDIGKVAPAPGEDEELGSKQRLASGAREFMENASAVAALLTESEDSVADRLGEAHRRLTALADIDPKSAETLLTACDAIQEETAALSRAVGDAAEKVELDPEALAAIEARMSAIFTLKRRYGPSLNQVLEAETNAKRQLELFREAQKRRSEFDAEEKSLRTELTTACDELGRLRRAAAGEFAAKAMASLRSIGFTACELAVEFTPSAPGPTGADRIELVFSANAGVPPRPLRRIASSGELSRLMLALKTVLADADTVPVVVFDEIDVNIGGETANAVGDELHRLGERRQILCISHLAQVAARADRHFRVIKHSESGSTRSESEVLDSAGREREIARMLGGGASALAHAKDILKGVGHVSRN